MIAYKEPFRLQNIEIVELDNPEKIAIWMLSITGERIEGGEFDKASLMDAILDFYNKNY
jgi:hypothetical protein